MWGDYHARELALLIRRMARREPYYTFFTTVAPLPDDAPRLAPPRVQASG